MSFGGGHMQDMVNRINQNRGLKSSSKQKFKANNREIISTKKKVKNEPPKTKKQVSDIELEKIKEEIRKQGGIDYKNEKLKKIIFYIALILCIMILLIWMN